VVIQGPFFALIAAGKPLAAIAMPISLSTNNRRNSSVISVLDHTKSHLLALLVVNRNSFVWELVLKD
jgi:hypothetical protein